MVVRKTHMQSGKKRRRVIRSGPVRLGGNSEEKGRIHGQRPTLVGVWQDTQIGSPSPVFLNMGGSWRMTGTNRRAIGSLDSAHEDCVWAGLPPQKGREGSTLAAAGFLMKALVYNPSQANTPAPHA